jgi:F420H(2)-dependent quinone reductase
MRRGSELNVRLFRATGGRLGSRWRVGRKFLRGVPVCLVTTTGRRSGLERTVPLLYLRDGDDVVVVASQGGMPRHPDWYHNLVADSTVRIELPGSMVDAVARVADAAERARLWPMLVELYPSFAVYQERADREIPVVVCSPRRD